jgi:DsbC/DsbD-like thiol-disulfide interchange protein
MKQETNLRTAKDLQPARAMAFVLAVAALLGSAILSPLRAQNSWIAQASEARVSLLDGGMATAAELRGQPSPDRLAFLAGVHVVLNAGWKTYWRAPGDGIPPHFDWSGSENLAQAQVLWPVPRRFADDTGQYAGYAEQVLFPVLIRPEDPSLPVRLRLQLEFGVCRDICVPEEVTLDRALGKEAREDERLQILEFLARTPQPAMTGPCTSGPSLARIEHITNGETDRLEVDLIAPRPDASVDLFAHRPDGSYLPMPRRISAKGESPARFALVWHAESDAPLLKDQPITLTAVADDQGCETLWPVALHP